MEAAKEESNKLIYAQCYLVTIATTLGTGILGLPITLAHSGFYPFLITFIFGFLIQVLLICFVTEILQRAHALQLAKSTNKPNAEAMPLYLVNEYEEFLDTPQEQVDSAPVIAGHILIPKEVNVQSPNLHLLGELFLCFGVRQIFDCVVIIQFMAFLVSYALAGSEAYAQVIGINNVLVVIPFFVWTLTFIIVFALSFIQPVVSVLTFVKGSMIIVSVIMTCFVGRAIKNEVYTDFYYIGEPFLMGTVALGGVMNIMPFLYGKIQPVQNQVSGFRCALILGLTTCAVINICWCWAVLDIVPQTRGCFEYQVKHNNSFHVNEPPHNKLICAFNLSLEDSGRRGEIATVPMTKIIHQLYPKYKWVAGLVQVFIMISVTVSYLTIGATLFHTISGWAESVFGNNAKADSYTSKMNQTEKTREQLKVKERCGSICGIVVSLLAFAVVFVIASSNIKSFVSTLDKAASLLLNLEAGVFIYIMIRMCRNAENESLKIPLPMPSWLYNLQYIIPIYFGFAIVFDIFVIIHQMIHSYTTFLLPWICNPVNNTGVIVSPAQYVAITKNITSIPNGTTTSTPSSVTTAVVTIVTEAYKHLVEDTTLKP